MDSDTPVLKILRGSFTNCWITATQNKTVSSSHQTLESRLSFGLCSNVDDCTGKKLDIYFKNAMKDDCSLGLILVVVSISFA